MEINSKLNSKPYDYLQFSFSSCACFFPCHQMFTCFSNKVICISQPNEGKSYNSGLSELPYKTTPSTPSSMYHVHYIALEFIPNSVKFSNQIVVILGVMQYLQITTSVLPRIQERMNKLNCFTSQLEYVFRLEETGSCAVGQNSLTPQGNSNINF